MLVVDIEVQENDETRPENEVEWCKSLPTENDSSKLYVIVFHGKSRYVHTWARGDCPPTSSYWPKNCNTTSYFAQNPKKHIRVPLMFLPKI